MTQTKDNAPAAVGALSCSRCGSELATGSDGRRYCRACRGRSPVWTDERLAWLREQVAVRAARHVAEELGINERTLRWVMNTHGIPGRGRGAPRTLEALERTQAGKLAVRDAKYPRGGPWTCVQCCVAQPVENFYQTPDSDRPENHTCRRCQRDYRLQRQYNITVDQYEMMLADQDGVCACCGKSEIATQRGVLMPLSVDHDHACCPGKRSCGKCVRALLCRECNRRVEAFESEGWAVYAAYLDAYA